ncbi:hypothetical protein PR202_gb08340 [Eleusine coracana subsp. coracana]|uniref:Uncharacterized protein n=1 Tax=Eleusine coracana subsp. coracana TaxID=191504 RepID=A0AAV5EEC8_ELECO|nr:hypothetical protein PR202_gb08340 [Eleusine coracana subsp. coracana]
MDYIHGYYKEALNRLTASLSSVVDEAGFCFGFLDPVSNIIVNTAAFNGAPSQAEKEANQEGELLRTRGRDQGPARGLVTFLTTYFRYLPDSEALRYLRLAKADLLVAVRLIEKDRDTDAFTIHQRTTKIALTCAALSAICPCAANDPKITRLVYGSLSLASHLHEVYPLLVTQDRLCSSILERLAKLFVQVLLHRIHGFYLKAISCIPAPCLHPVYHWGLLRAGHCYGPFDPVTNIILNTIWYDTAFPPAEKTLFPALSTYDAVRYLLFHNADLDSVISRAKLDGYESATPLSDAYKAAACAAKHPDPTALANLSSGLFLDKGELLKSLIKTKLYLSLDDVDAISISLSQNDPPRKPVGLVQELTPRASRNVSSTRKEFEAQQSSICKRGDDYELLAICGVNGEIPEDGKFGYFDNYNGYPYSHINIWARLKGPRLADAAPTLLFIQCSNDSEVMDYNFLCVPVLESLNDAGHCFHCEYYGAKIVHPSSSETYLGQSYEFEEMARGEHPMTSDELVRCGRLKTIFVDTSEVDCIYFDPAWDADTAARLNRDAKVEEGKGNDIVQARSRMVKEVLREMAAFIDLKKKEMASSIG